MLNQVNLYVFFCIVICFCCNAHASRIAPKNDKNCTTIFNVKDFGAKGDGVTDDSKAFEKASTSACKVENGVMYIPADFTFLLQPIIFNGAKCKLNLTVQVDGTIVAPSNIKDWKRNGERWILFSGFSNGLVIRGEGAFDGCGEDWWKHAKSFLTYEEWIFRDPKNTMKERPHAIVISASKNITLTGITIRNSPQMHIYFDTCEKVFIYDITLSSPGDSPNTDGIHLYRTIEVDIHNSTLACGDDCVSVQSGCHNVSITNVHCGPGHGYSLGSLGYNLHDAHVSNINVSNSFATNASNGLRIKTWEGATGSVRNIVFEHIKLDNIQNPIIIDQHYCNGTEFCNSTGSSKALNISGVTFKNITGTYTKRAVALVCSESIPCHNIDVSYIDLKPRGGQGLIGKERLYCEHAYGKLLTRTIPSLVKCLNTSKVGAPYPFPLPSPSPSPSPSPLPSPSPSPSLSPSPSPSPSPSSLPSPSPSPSPSLSPSPSPSTTVAMEGYMNFGD